MRFGLLLPAFSGRNAEYFKLRRVHIGRGLRQRAGAVLDLGEGDHLAQVRRAYEQHHQPVKSEGEAGVRGRAVAERAHHEAKTRLDLLIRKAQRAEHPLLHLGVVYPYAAAAELHAV